VLLVFAVFLLFLLTLLAFLLHALLVGILAARILRIVIGVLLGLTAAFFLLGVVLP